MKQRFAVYMADPKRWAELMGRSHRLLERETGQVRVMLRRRQS